MITFKIYGTVREAETGIGLLGLFVKAYDKDLLFDDLLGSTYTTEGGRFEIISEPEDFRDFFDVKPDIYLKVFAPDAERLLYTTEKAVRWEAGRLEEFDVRIPRDCLGNLAPTRTVRLLDDSGEERSDFDAGESLTVQVEGVQPETVHGVVLLDENGEELFTNSLMSNCNGVIEPTTIWPQLGLEDPHTGEKFTVEQAQERWQGRELRLEIRTDGKVVLEQVVRFADAFTRPLILSTDADGIVVNGFEAGERDAIVSGHNVSFRGRARVFMVPRRHGWQPGDPFSPVQLASGRLAFVDVDIDEDRRFCARLARARELEPGAYGFIVRPLRYGYEDQEVLELSSTDFIARWEAGLVVREGSAVSTAVRFGSAYTQPISGRRICGQPYFQYADTFQVGDDIYAALEPTALDPSVIGKMVALYVVRHKSSMAWSSDPSLNHLAVLGGNEHVLQFKTQSGCISFNDRLVWPSASIVGAYDIVADFGNNTPDASAFVTDASFDQPHDIIDGYFVAGFRVVPDPATDIQFSHAAGSFEYSEGTVTVTDDYGSTVTVEKKAKVYFPADAPDATTPSQISTAQANYPLVVVVHGNSGATTSYLGYNYLLEHLAKNGFIAASIHLNPNMRGTGRARVLFEHIDILNTKFGTHVANNIGIMGHSRGGEAVAIAARLNYEESLGHNINAVISLAPTDQYTNENLGGAWATPYLVVYGSMDGDVAGGSGCPMNTGFALYDRASGERKCMVFVYGATHGRFNTVWGDTDLYFDKIGSSDWAKLITADAHQKVAKGYMTAFFRRFLQNQVQWDGIFKGEWVPAAVEQADSGNVKLYVQYQDQDSPRTVVDNFEGEHDTTSWQTSTIGGAVNDDNSLPVDPVENQLCSLDTHSPHDTAGLLLRWDGVSDQLRFEVPTAHKDVRSYNALSFRVTQKVSSASNPAGQAQDLYVTCKDKGGKSRSIKVNKFGEIPPPHGRHDSTYTKSAMCTIRIPLHVFTIAVLGTDQVALDDVDSITFDFKAKPKGEIEIDSVEFTS